MRRLPRNIDAEAKVSGIPARFLRYDPADWIDNDCHPECAFYAERDRWWEQASEAGRDQLSDLSDNSTFPDGPWHPELI